MAELAFGLDTDDLVERQARTDRFYAVLREMAVGPFDLAAARLYGTLAATVRRSGRNPRPRRTDLQIAATAGAQAIPLVTRNPDDFAGLERFVDVVVVRPPRCLRLRTASNVRSEIEGEECGWTSRCTAISTASSGGCG